MITNRKPYRPPKKAATQHYATYRIASPVDTHTRPATCEEYRCEAFHNGWSYLKAELEEKGLLYQVTHAGKKFIELETEQGTALFFEPGQKCFSERKHRVTLDRPEWYFAGNGDHRSFTVRHARKFQKPEHWVEQFAIHSDRIKTRIERG